LSSPVPSPPLFTIEDSPLPVTSDKNSKHQSTGQAENNGHELGNIENEPPSPHFIAGVLVDTIATVDRGVKGEESHDIRPRLRNNSPNPSYSGSEQQHQSGETTFVWSLVNCDSYDDGADDP
jgi:hypothetical protein